MSTEHFMVKNKPKIVSIGGGTGLSTMLRGLKMYTDRITAVVTVADDGGGSGVLRSDLNMPPPGDIRNCLLALSETEPVMEKLLRHRFSGGRLRGQSFGNLLLAAMNEIYQGDFVTAIQSVSDVLKVTGKVLPVTDEDVELVAVLENGQKVFGESNIGHCLSRYGCRIETVCLRNKKKPSEEIVPVKEIAEEIQQADLITLGPGSLYTSVLPNLCVHQLAEIIHKAKAPVVYINNIMTQPGETDGYTAFDHVQAILKHTCPDFIDYCIVNNRKIDTPLLSKYIEQDAEAVPYDSGRFLQTRISVIEKDLVGIQDNRYIRHDAVVLADTILDIVNKVRMKDSAAVSEEGVLLYQPKRSQKK